MQWNSLVLGELPPWSQLAPQPGKYALEQHAWEWSTTVPIIFSIFKLVQKMVCWNPSKRFHSQKWTAQTLKTYCLAKKQFNFFIDKRHARQMRSSLLKHQAVNNHNLLTATPTLAVTSCGYRFSAFWLRSKCSICSYQLNIWYGGHVPPSILNWFLEGDRVQELAPALSRVDLALQYRQDRPTSPLTKNKLPELKTSQKFTWVL